MKAGDVYRDTQSRSDETFTLRVTAVSDHHMPGWLGTRSDYGEWFVTDLSLGEYYVPVVKA